MNMRRDENDRRPYEKQNTNFVEQKQTDPNPNPTFFRFICV